MQFKGSSLSFLLARLSPPSHWTKTTTTTSSNKRPLWLNSYEQNNSSHMRWEHYITELSLPSFGYLAVIQSNEIELNGVSELSIGAHEIGILLASRRRLLSRTITMDPLYGYPLTNWAVRLGFQYVWVESASSGESIVVVVHEKGHFVSRHSSIPSSELLSCQSSASFYDWEIQYWRGAKTEPQKTLDIKWEISHQSHRIESMQFHDEAARGCADNKYNPNSPHVSFVCSQLVDLSHLHEETGPSSWTTTTQVSLSPLLLGGQSSRGWSTSISCFELNEIKVD